MSTSSADPFKLSSYSCAGLEHIATLSAKSTAVTNSSDALVRSGSGRVPPIGDVPTAFADLVGDWYHLDEFVGDVANGFFQADERLDRTTGPIVVTLDDATLIREGRVGYADRDIAIADARAMAAELDRLSREGAHPEALRAFVARAGRGQYDPAFAVTFSELVGVGGYVETMGLIRQAWPGKVPPEGISMVDVFGTMLTTALDTLPGIPAEDLRYPENALLADDQRLDRSFADQLVDGWQPATSDERWDLSVLMRFTDPPTAVAVAVANSRMTPRLLGLDRSMERHPGDEPWGDYAGLVTNYATMLGRNPDASSLWLTDTNNAGLLLQRPFSHDIDSGLTLAHMVDVGLTNGDPALRGQAMTGVITAWGAQGEDAGILNPHLYDSLSDGVAANMPVIDQLVNGTFVTDVGSADLRATRSFLDGLAEDPAAAQQIHTALVDYVDQQLDLLPGGRTFGPDDRNSPVGLERLDRLEELGRLFGVQAEAEAHAAAQAIYAEASDAGKEAGIVNYLVKFVPGLDEANLAARLIVDQEAGDVVNSMRGKNLTPEEIQRRLVQASIEVQLDAKGEIDGLVLDRWDRAAMLSTCDCSPLPR